MSVFDELNNSALNQFELTNLNTIQVNPNIQNSSSFPQFPIPFNFTSLSTNQLANKYYNNNEVFSNSGFKVYFDEESKGIIDDTNPVQELDEVVVKAFRNARSKEFDNFKLVMFTSTDGVKILQQYKQVDVNPDEIAVFFELDNSTNVFGSVMRIKVGVNILKNENLPYREILEFATKDRNGVAINLNQNKLKRLIKKGVYKDKENLFSFVISTLTDGLSSVIQYTAGGIGNFFFTSIPKELSKLKFTDKDWDTETEGYNPFFIPSSFIEYVEKQQGKTNAEKKIIETLIKPLFNKFNGLQDDALRTLEASKALIPNKVYRKLKAFIKVILKQIKSIEEAFLDSNLGLLALIQKNAQVINAFLCGLFNSIVDFVNGIFQLIGLVFIGIKEANNFANNIGYYTSIAIEFVENIIEGIINIDFKSLLIQTLLFPLKLKNIFQAGISAFNITLEQTAYFIGFIGGFIIETIISIFFTGGALTLNKVLINFWIA